MGILIVPSLLSVNLAFLADDIDKVEMGGADALHVDVMDGHYVDNFAFSADFAATVKKHSRLMMSSHLMIDNPDKYLEMFANAGSDIIVVHPEVCHDVSNTLKKIKELGCSPGLCLKPDQLFDVIRPYVGELALILLMTVEPGFGGQKFMFEVLPKITEVREYLNSMGLRTCIGCDGGINLNTVGMVARAGADYLIAGNSIFHSSNIVQSTRDLRKAAEEAIGKI
ncbi:MAG: ribulose-phosphate 3-epimerase [Actinobacteria bacterium]|nr:ribulose-phosphate 3-epimerase [Actinomycetota bacterium]